jgi:hypothetical protein
MTKLGSRLEQPQMTAESLGLTKNGSTTEPPRPGKEAEPSLKSQTSKHSTQVFEELAVLLKKLMGIES